MSDSILKWEDEWFDYEPVEFCQNYLGLYENNQFIVENLRELDSKIDENSKLVIDKKTVNDRPLNPIGRTGIAGKGLLQKWGPNNGLELIVTK